MISIGVDPGVVTGYAEAQGGKIIRLESVDFWGAYDRIVEYRPEEIRMITVEVSSTTNVWHDTPGKGSRVKRAAKVGQNVGGVRREGQLMVQRLQQIGYTARSINPLGKMTAERFKRITGWTGSSNEHTRDAGIMAFLGKS